MRLPWVAAVLALTSASVLAIEIGGASTIQPLMKGLGPAIERAVGEPMVLRGGGSRAGALAVLAGRADVGMVSRSLHEDERARLKSETIGYDALAIVVNLANPITELSKAQLFDIYSGRIDNWKALGGADRPIVLVSKEVGRSTLELFEDYTGLVSPDRGDANGRPRIAARAHIIGSNLESLTLVGGLPGAIGYVSVGTARSLATAGLAVRILKLDGIEPDEQSIVDRSYPVIRQLNLVFRERTAKVDKLLTLMRGPEGVAAIRRHGFLPVAKR